jgi:zinc transport system permease protein
MNWIDDWLWHFSQQFPDYIPLNSLTYVHGLVAILLLSIMCGGVGSLVVGNRMAFFSDALAHCAFAGIGLALLIGIITGMGRNELMPWITTIMVVFGIVVGLGIAYVRDKTNLASDTVIGVFFAGAIGFGAVMLKAGSARSYFSPETFLFGDLAFLDGNDLLHLLILVLVTVVFLIWSYNRLVFTSFNTSLALSRQIPMRLFNYLFITLLAVIVNVCLKSVGALLINALLIVPAATAANLCKNMRQLFWCSMGLCLFSGILGQWLSWQVFVATSRGRAVHPGDSGTIVVIAVILFFVSMVIGPWLKNRRAAPPVKETALASRAA